MKDNTDRVFADVPVDVATYLLNEKRGSINEIETRNAVTLLIVANPTFETPNYTIERVRSSDSDHDTQKKNSYELATDNAEAQAQADSKPSKPIERAAVGNVVPDMPAPTPAKAVAATAATTKAGGLKGIIGKVTSIFGGKTAEVEPTPEPEEEKTRKNNNNRNRNQNRKPRAAARKRKRGRETTIVTATRKTTIAMKSQRPRRKPTTPTSMLTATPVLMVSKNPNRSVVDDVAVVVVSAIRTNRRKHRLQTMSKPTTRQKLQRTMLPNR